MRGTSPLLLKIQCDSVTTKSMRPKAEGLDLERQLVVSGVRRVSLWNWFHLLFRFAAPWTQGYFSHAYHHLPNRSLSGLYSLKKYLALATPPRRTTLRQNPPTYEL